MVTTADLERPYFLGRTLPGASTATVDLINAGPELWIHRDTIHSLTGAGFLTVSADGRVFRFVMGNGTWTYVVAGLDPATRCLVLRWPD